jgi:hypothetical protein
MAEFNLVDIILSHIQSNNKRLYTSLPAVVDKFYPDTNSIDATILVSDTIGIDNIIASGKVVNVPVQFPSGGSFKQGWKLVKGDNVLLNFTMRSLDEYHNSKGKKPLKMSRKRYHNVSDCFATVGAFPKEAPVISSKYAGQTFLEDKGTAIVFNENGTGLEIISDKDVVINTTGDVRIKGNLIVEGDITATGGNIEATIVMNDLIPVGGSVVANTLLPLPARVPLETHTHPVISIGSPTGVPISI